MFERLRAALADRYRVDRELGRGGMATVFLAEDLKHRRPVAIKVLDPELAGQLGPERFVREIETAARLQHPHILTILDSGAESGLLYYVMPWIEGDSLRQRLARERQLSVDEAVRIATDVARALDHAHRRGIVHRDVKPENVLLADGEAMIADFGIAAAIAQSGGEKLTQSGFTVGTPAYMSPEQVTGTQAIDGRSDLYSLGCMLYELLAGQPPFTGPVESLARQHLNLAPRPIRDLRPTVSDELATLLDRALAKLPADRPASGAEFATALGAVRVPTPEPMATTPVAGTTPAATSAATVALGAAGAATPTGPGAAAPTPAAASTPEAATAVPEPSRSAGPWRPIGFGLAIVAAIAIGILLWRAQAQRPASTVAAAAQRRWVWLADFEGPATDPSLGPAARDLVASSFDASKELATISDEQVRIALRNAGKADSSRITPALARELAFRSAIPVVVEGTVGAIGSGYTIALRATQAEDGHLIHSVSGQAAGERDLIPELTRLARELRRSLGENADAFRGTQSWADAPTPSLEAFKLYRAGRLLVLQNEDDRAVPLLRQAVAVDPEFATAWAYLGTAFGNLDLRDSANAAREEALRHASRLTPARKLYIEAAMASDRYDRNGAIAAYDAILELNPSPVDRSAAMVNRANALLELGRNEEALEAFRQVTKVSPIETPPTVALNTADALLALNRLEEARTELLAHPTNAGRLSLVEIEMLERHWSAAESLAAPFVSNPSFPDIARWRAGYAIAGIQMNRGRFAETVAGIRDPRLSIERPRANGARWLILEGLSLANDGALPAYESPRGDDAWQVAARAILAARAGDRGRTQAALAVWPVPDDREGRAALEGYVAAVFAARDQRWNDVVEQLAPLARLGYRRVPGLDAMLRPSMRWRVADAFAHLDQPDSAAAYLDLILHPPATEPPCVPAARFWEPFVRRQLVRLAVRAGRLDEAERQWKILSETCTRPDAEAQRLLDETRGMLRAATGMEEGRRR